MTSVIIEGVHEPESGGRQIRTTQRRAVRSVPAPPLRRSAAALAALFFGVLAVAVAPPAAAIDDPTLPDARVTNGPSCRPGGLVVEVVAGTAPYEVRLATTRTPAGEDAAVLAPGETVVLRTGDVAPGETIDGRLEYTAQDGSGSSYVDELENYTFTRPTIEDCEAAASPPPQPTPPATPTTPAPPTTPQPEPEPEPSAEPEPTAPPTGTPSPAPSTSPRPPSTSSPTGARPTSEGQAALNSVPAGSLVTVRVGGFVPGEQVTITLQTTGERLASATAGDDGSVTAEVRIPARTEPGQASLGVQGERSAVVADVPLQVASALAEPPAESETLVPLLAAAALAATGIATLTASAGRRPGRR